MRKFVSWVLVALGAFLLVSAVLATVWAPAQVKKAPTDTDSTTRLSGTAAAIPAGDTDVDVRAVSITEADSKNSDDAVVVYASYTCLVRDVPGVEDCPKPVVDGEPNDNVISIGEPDIFATHRTNASAVNDAKYLPPGTPPTEGLVNKFPFDTEKKSYPFWDGVLERTVPVQYEGEAPVDGLDTYRFSYSVQNETAEIAAGVEGTYSMQKTMWIEPKTGQIIDQQQHDVRQLDGRTILDVNLSFTDEQVQANVEDAQSNISRLRLVTELVPVLGYVLGAASLLVGVLMLVLGSRRSRIQ